MDARLIIDTPAPGSWNMAVDDVLFQGIVPSGPAVIRFYRWSEPTLSLGYFQQAADREGHAASRSLPLVRRATGGGAIVHDRELTYSLSLPLVDDRPGAARAILVAVHESLAKLLADLRIRLQFHGAKLPRIGREPFLCFRRRAPEDLVLESDKVVGSAQRRRRHALLQHGSILLQRSPAAPELIGIEDRAGTAGLAAQLLARWPDRIAEVLGLSISTSSLTPVECDRSQAVRQSRYTSDGWNRKR